MSKLDVFCWWIPMVAVACSAGGVGADASTDGAAPNDAATDAGSFEAGACGPLVVDPEVVTAGNPSWKRAELALFRAPVGTVSDNGAEGIQSIEAVFTPKHTFDAHLFLLKSAIAHDPPYDTEVAAGLVQAGFQNTGCLGVADLTAPSGIIIAMNLVPSASAPSAKSFERPGGGPVITFSALGINGDLFNGTTLVDPNFDTSFPQASVVYGDTTIGGYGHLLLVWGENAQFSPNPLTAGQYSFQISLDDGTNGTSDVVHFVVQ